MNLFMERSEYVFDTSANMEIESLTRKCKALEADYAVSNREMLLMQVEIGELKSELARRDEQISTLVETVARLKEDGERLANSDYRLPSGVTKCPYCSKADWTIRPDGKSTEIHHSSDCPITLHRALMKELE